MTPAHGSLLRSVLPVLLLCGTAAPALAQPGPPPRPTFDPRGWEHLGASSPDGRYDRDVIRVGRDEGAFTHLMFTISGGDAEIYEIIVTLGDGERFEPQGTRLRFRDGVTTGGIDLPGRARGVRSVEFRYGSHGGRPRLDLYGKPFAPEPPPPPAPPPPPRWDPRDWHLIGQAEVNGRRDTDVIRIRGHHGTRQLMIEAKRGALEMFDVVVFFRDGSRYSPETRLIFGPNSRTQPIDLPGDVRLIRAIEFKYGSLGREGAYVNVWAR